MSGIGFDDDDRALAGEYVLGLLDDAETASVRARIRADAAFAAEVAAWREWFAGLDAETDPVAPPPRVRAAIEARLFPAAAPRRRSIWGMLSGLAAASVVAIGLFFAVPVQAPAPILLASLASADQALQLRVGVTPGEALMHVILDAGGPPEGRVLQLWAVAEGQDPVPLTLIERADFFIADFPRDLVDAGLTVAVSEEPPGGSPTGQPTGAVIATGTLEETQNSSM